MSLPCSMFGGEEVPASPWGQAFADLTLGERMAELKRRSLADPDEQC